MINIYANLIILGEKTLEDVPERLRAAVAVKVEELRANT